MKFLGKLDHKLRNLRLFGRNGFTRIGQIVKKIEMQKLQEELRIKKQGTEVAF